MELEKAIDILKSLNNGYSFSDCEVCENYNELTGTCDKEKCDELIAIETVIAELHAMQNLLDEKREELEHLQKENEELKDIDLTTVYLKGILDEKERWRNKIREKIEKEKTALETCYGRIKYQEGKIEGLQDLLKEE